MTTTGEPGTDRHPADEPAAPGWLLAVTLVLLAANLRIVVITVGPLLVDIQADLGMSDTVAGVLLTLPVLTFGVIGFTAGRIIRRLTPVGTLLIALVLIAAGTAVRALAPTAGWLLVASLLALIGIAVGNVLAPTLVRAWFPRSVGRATAWYTTALTLGTAVPAALAVPTAVAVGGWRPGLAVWALLAAAALVPAIVVALRTRSHTRAGPAPAVQPPAGELARHVRRQPTSWALAAFLGLQALEAYTIVGFLPAILQDAGVPAARAGTLLAVLVGIGAPIAIVLPRLATRRGGQRPVIIVLVAASFAGQLGLLLAPAAAPLLWVVLLGVGSGAFLLALLLITLRTSVASGTAALSSFVQGVGYLVAAVGPVAAGALRDISGGWTVPLTLLLLLLVPKVVFGLLASRPVTVDTPT